MVLDASVRWFHTHEFIVTADYIYIIIILSMYLTHPGHTGDAVLPMQATSKVHLSTSGPKRSDH